jgi:hypothetical protein
MSRERFVAETDHMGGCAKLQETDFGCRPEAADFYVLL